MVDAAGAERGLGQGYETLKSADVQWSYLDMSPEIAIQYTRGAYSSLMPIIYRLILCLSNQDILSIVFNCHYLKIVFNNSYILFNYDFFNYYIYGIFALLIKILFHIIITFSVYAMIRYHTILTSCF